MERVTVPPFYHVLAAGGVAWCTWLALQRPDSYSAAMQEDRAIEWATVLFFAAAGIIGLARAVRQRRVFDGLVALFCLVFAGEEMSWGQRLIGLTPPAYFLEHNTQQEMNVHNFGEVLGSPKWPFVIVLAGYSVILPLVALSSLGRRLLARIGATPPPSPTIPWFLAAIALLAWYPFRFTGEWIELLAGSAFLAATGLPGVAFLTSTAVFSAAAIALATWSSRGDADPARITCASAEVRAIADMIASDSVTELRGMRSVHKRVWTMSRDGYVEFNNVERALNAVSCPDDRDAPSRRQFAVDPWGSAYWVRIEAGGVVRHATVYSFGPNRRRDVNASATRTGDDIVVRRSISALAPGR